MNPHSKPRPLFFTPRTPWGRLPQKHAHQNHMRASEDKKLQGLAGQMAPNLPGGSGGQPRGTGKDVWNVPHLDDRDYPLTLYPAAQPSFRQTSSPGVVRYDSSQDKEELDKALGKGKHGVEGTVEGSKLGAERTDLNADASIKFPADAEPPKDAEDYFKNQRHGPLEQKERTRQQENETRHTVNMPPYVFPSQQQPPPQPIRIAPAIPASFTPRKKNPPPPSTLQPYVQP